MTKDCLGILVNDGIWEGIAKEQTGYERIDFYLEAANMYELIPCFFRLRDISLRRKKVKALVKHNGRWDTRILRLPSVIHNRAIFQSPNNFTRCKKLVDHGAVLFNFWNRYSKMRIADILGKSDAVKPYLPASAPFSLSDLAKMGQEYASMMVKPDRGTVGEGIIKIDQISPLEWKVKYREGTALAERSVQTGELYTKLKRLVGKHDYLLQETIDLATHQGSPFDLRVSVQKDGRGEWGVTGIVGKAARPGHFLSNVAQGGTVHKWEEFPWGTLGLSFQEVEKKVKNAAMQVVQVLDQNLPHLADVGFDFGIDRQGHPYFIEMNGRDQRYSFAKGDMMETWKMTYEKPVAYARYLLDSRRRG
ncbi:YheC/YheD family protein [Ammoniphilus sp. 3BR4]|uniref:YheC/YheD family endospore coat-associated protein n=1 Tax=Ammoniphilus sp. 3BR4 TaxID=3158265 RepID=UPI003465C281